jgi:hypothetical protein
MLPPLRYMLWFAHKIHLHYEFVKQIDWDFRLYMMWALYRKCLWIGVKYTPVQMPRGTMLVPVPFAGLLLRPGFFETPGFPDDAYSWDKDGPDLWVDFCYAPGHYADVIAFLKSRCTREIGWFRQKTGENHRCPIGKLRAHSLLGLA